MRGTPIAVALTALLLMGAAPGEPLRVHWSAHEGCPDLNGFWQQIGLRSPTLRRALPGEEAHDAKVTIARVDDQSVATLVLDASTVRRVSGATCSEAVRALAIVAVIALDGGTQTPPAPSAPPAASSPTVPPSVSAPTVASSSPPPEALPPTSPRPADRADVESPAPPTRAWLGIGAGALSAGTVSTFTTSAAFELERARSASVRLSLDRGESSFVESAPGTGASFTWMTGRLDACFTPWSLANVLALRTCAAFEGGALQGVPRGATNATSRARAWFAAYAVARLQWFLASGFAFELEGAGGAPFSRDEFVFDPRVVVYRPGAWLARARLGMLVRFP